MLLEQLTVPGSFGILYEVLKTGLSQLPTVFTMISTAPTVALQIGAMAIVVVSAGGIVFVVEKIKDLIKKINDKL
ncbi:MAG: hypothetical protein IJ800_01805 [Clostridia bacterium]|nr:hypothetical protein [Clostridia bacterium]